MKIKQSPTSVNFTKNGLKEIRGIVIHSMDGYYKGSISWFKNPKSEASAHFLISAKGEITQMVDLTDSAWHAGVFDKPLAKWLMPNPNKWTVGIELEDKKDRNWKYPELQRKALRELVSWFMKKYTIPRNRIVLHKELNPSRRSDPIGAFSRDWLFGGDDMNELNKCVNDRNLNWDVFNKVMKAIGIEADSNDKLKSAEVAVKSIAGIKAELEQEVKNKKEEISRVNNEMLASELGFRSAIKRLNQEIAEADSRIQGLKEQVETTSREKGRALIELSKCQAGKSTNGFIIRLVSLIKRIWRK